MIRYLKLVSGEHIVGEVELQGDAYEIKNPMAIMVGPNGSAGFMPFAIGLKADQSVQIAKSFVMFDGEVETEVKNAWSANFGSGIVVPEIHVDI